VEKQKEVITNWIKEIVTDSYPAIIDKVDNEIDKKKINNSLETYSADIIGRADYAVALSGGKIIKSSPTYKNEWWNLFIKTQQSEVILDPDVNVGNCWPMKGSTGSVTIQLAKTIIPTAVSLEHVSSKIAHNIDTAPQQFRVLGINQFSEEVLLGIFKYEIEGKQIQTFELKNTKQYAYIKLEILSNYGSKEYTCIYRFRVHAN